jgi:hypothetical protein
MNSMNIDRNALTWRTARKSGTVNCVEVTRTSDGVVLFRNSKRPDGDMVAYTGAEFDAFVDGVKRGEFDDFLA